LQLSIVLTLSSAHRCKLTPQLASYQPNPGTSKQEPQLQAQQQTQKTKV
jgi:hypothetical protein